MNITLKAFILAANNFPEFSQVVDPVTIINGHKIFAIPSLLAKINCTKLFQVSQFSNIIDYIIVAKSLKLGNSRIKIWNHKNLMPFR